LYNTENKFEKFKKTHFFRKIDGHFDSEDRKPEVEKVLPTLKSNC